MTDDSRWSASDAPFPQPDRADPDLMLVVEYCSGELTDEQAEQVDLRLATDPSFRLRAEPLIDAWLLATHGPPSGTSAEIPADVEARALARFRAELMRTKDRQQARMSRWLPRRTPWRTAIAATLLLFLVPATLITKIVMLNHGPSGVGVADVAGHWFLYKARVTGNPADNTMVDLGDGSRAEVAAGATFAFRRTTPSTLKASLTGGAVLQIQPGVDYLRLLVAIDSTTLSPREFLAFAVAHGLSREASFQHVLLDAVDFLPGRYRVHAFGRDSLVVDVESGQMRTVRAGKPEGGVSFSPREHVVITAVGIISFRP